MQHKNFFPVPFLQLPPSEYSFLFFFFKLWANVKQFLVIIYHHILHVMKLLLLITSDCSLRSVIHHCFASQH